MDIERANYILAHDSVYPYIRDDFTTDENRYRLGELLVNTQGVYVIMPTENTLFFFNPHNSILYEGHMHSLPEDRGRKFIKAAKEAIGWMFERTLCKKIMGLTPEWQKGALKMAMLCGFKREGKLSKANIRNGKLYDIIITGLTKDEWI